MSDASLAGLARGKRQKLPYDDAQLYAKIGGRYVRLMRKHEAQQALMDVGLHYHAANYRLNRAARLQEIRSTVAHAHTWLYFAEDVAAFVQRIAHDSGTQE